MPEFDFPTAIEELAKATGPCPGCKGEGSRLEADASGGVSSQPCSNCSGTGRIMLFLSLRVTCSHYPTKATAEEWAEFRAWHDTICPGWIPEPDVRVACWEVLKVLGLGWQPYGKLTSLPPETAVIRAALAWAKEQHASISR